GDGELLRKAKELYLTALALFRRAGDPLKEMQMLHMLSDIYSTFGEAEQGVELAKQAVTIAFTLKLPAWEANGLMYVGEAYLRLSDYRSALEVFQQALPIWRALGTGSSWGVGWTLHSVGNCYRWLGERPKEIEFYEEALKLYQMINGNLCDC